MLNLGVGALAEAIASSLLSALQGRIAPGMLGSSEGKALRRAAGRAVHGHERAAQLSAEIDFIHKPGVADELLGVAVGADPRGWPICTEQWTKLFGEGPADAGMAFIASLAHELGVELRKDAALAATASILGVRETLAGLARIEAAVSSARHEDEGDAFPGLRPFRAADRHFFVGRDDEIDRLVSMLGETWARGGRILVTGASGVGKSSFIGAGIVPVMEAQGHWAVAASIAPDLQSVEQIRQEALVAVAEGKRLLLIIDQAERLLASRDGFTGVGEGLMGSPTSALFIVRKEFVGDALDRIGSDAICFPLLALARDQLVEVIAEPARRAGLRIKPSLAARIANDAGSGSALPLLADTMARLQEVARKTGTTEITTVMYDLTGRVAMSIEVAAEAALLRLLEAQSTEDEVLASLLELVTVEPDRPAMGRSRLLSEFSPSQRRVLDEFVEARLLTVDGFSVVPAHDTLLESWRRLRDAIVAHRTDLEFDDELTRRAKYWTRRGQSAVELLSGSLLHAATRRMLARADNVDPLVRHFVQCSIDAERRASAEIAREIVRENRHVHPDLLLALARALTDEHSSPEADDLLRYAVWRQDWDAEELLVPRGTDRAWVAPGARYVLTAETPVASEGAARAAISRDWVRAWDPQSGRECFSEPSGHAQSGRWRSLLFSPDGRYVLACQDGIAKIWDALTKLELSELELSETKQPGLRPPTAFYFNGHTAMAVSAQGELLVWSGSEVVRVVAKGIPSAGAVFSPDGRRIAVAAGSTVPYERPSGSTSSSLSFVPAGGLRILDALTGTTVARTEELPGHGDWHIAFTEDSGRVIASSLEDPATVATWDLDSDQWKLGCPADVAIISPVFSVRNGLRWCPPDRSRDRLGVVSEIISGRALLRVRASAAGFCPDGRLMAVDVRTRPLEPSNKELDIRWLPLEARAAEVLRAPGEIERVLALSDGRVATLGPDGHGARRQFAISSTSRDSFSQASLLSSDGITDVSGDGRLALIGRQAEVVLQELARGDIVRRWHLHSETVRAVALSFGAERYAIAYRDLVITGNTADERSAESFRHPSGMIDYLGFSADGQRLAAVCKVSVGPDGPIIAWDVTTHETVCSASSMPPKWTCASFAGDGRTLAVGCADGTLHILRLDLHIDEDPYSSNFQHKQETGMDAVALSRDGRFAAGASGQWVRVWDLAARRQLLAAAHAGRVVSMDFAADCSSIVTSTAGGEIWTWHLPWKEMQVRDTHARALTDEERAHWGLRQLDLSR